MSFLNTNNSEFISARVTQKGRNAIAKGSFNIRYFQIGDSEFDYSTLLTTISGQTRHQMVFSPFEKEAGIKYPYKIDSSSETTYVEQTPEPVNSEPIRNVMGPAGFVSEYFLFNSSNAAGTTIATHVEEVNISALSGNAIPVVSGDVYQDAKSIMLVYGDLGGTDPNNPVIKENNTSLIFKIISISGNTLNLDRNLTTETSPVTTVQVIAIGSEIEFANSSVTEDCSPIGINNLSQQNSWAMNIPWSEKPIGVNVNGDDNTIAGYESSGFNSTKELLGYGSDSQTFSDLSRENLIDIPTGYKNSLDEDVHVPSEQQRTIAIIHYSELGDVFYNPERFFKYDDYISNNDNVEDSIFVDEEDIELTDKEYFEVFIPFIKYHRDTTTDSGALFTMGDTDYYINSSINATHQLKFRYLQDVNGNNVGKVFVNNKTIVFDDQELVAILDYRSNRRHTLPAPKLGLDQSALSAADSMITGTTGTTMWVTYSLQSSADPNDLNSLPCNYYSKVDGVTTPSNLTIRFGNEFSYLTTDPLAFGTRFQARKFYVLLQETDYGELPESHLWVLVDLTSAAGGNGTDFLWPENLVNVSFTLNRAHYEDGDLFDLEDFITGLNGGYTTINEEQFGGTQPFPGSIKLVRGSDVQQMNFMVNLPSNQFLETQNPTYVEGDKVVTEIALLDSNKETLVMSKTPLPVKREGMQNFSVRIDF